ncbi:sodium-dependent glucose transporter 1-like [Haemaphysalis longicornis]
MEGTDKPPEPEQHGSSRKERPMLTYEPIVAPTDTKPASVASLAAQPAPVSPAALSKVEQQRAIAEYQPAPASGTASPQQPTEEAPFLKGEAEPPRQYRRRPSTSPSVDLELSRPPRLQHAAPFLPPRPQAFPQPALYTPASESRAPRLSTPSRSPLAPEQRRPSLTAAAAPTTATAAPPPPTSLQPAPWKAVTVADMTDRTEAQALHRKWEHEHLDWHSDSLFAAAGGTAHHASRRDRLFKAVQTIVVHASFFGAGMYYAIFGPTVQDLAVVMDVGLFRVLFLLAARAVGFFVGAVTGAVVLRPVNPQVAFVLLNFLLTMACLGVSYIDTLLPYQLLFGLGGFALGAISVLGVLWTSALWREASGFLVRTLTFTFCLGCVLGPLLSEPFITDRSIVTGDSAIPAPLSDLNNLEDKDFIYVGYAYWLISVYAFCVAFLALVAMFVDPGHQDLRDMESQCPVLPCSGFVVLLFFYLAACLAVETLSSQLVAPFALLLGHNKTAATYMTSLFWAAFTAVRGVAIACFPQRGSFDALLFCNAVLVAATGFSAFFGPQTRLLWIGTAVVGACMAPSMPSALLLLHDYSGVSISRFALAMLVACASSSFPPLCVGAKLERQPMLFHQALAALSTVALVLALIGKILLRRIAIEERYVRLPTDDIRRPSYKALKRRE